jgi:hypothetical protein
VKAFANSTGTTRDEELSAMLISAINKVEDICGFSLTENTFRLYTEGLVTSAKLFYPPFLSITSVLDARTGEAVTYESNYDFSMVYVASSDLVVEYKTSATCSNVLQFKQNVIEYCSLLFDGQTDEIIINSVLRKIPRSIC